MHFGEQGIRDAGVFFGQYTLVHSAAYFSICLSVTIRSTPKTVRDRPTVTMDSLLWVQGYSRTHPQPLRPPFPQTGGSQPPVKTCIANCGQTVPDTMMVYTDSLSEHTITLPNSTIVDGRPLRAPFPQKGGSQKIKLKAAASAKS